MSMESIRIENMYDLNETIAAEIFEGKTYPWEVLPLIKEFIVKLEIHWIRQSMIRSGKISG